jgi:Winged helix-turn helix
MAAVSMSKQEFGRLEVLLRVQSGRLRVADACALIGLRRRQVFRLLRDVKQDGAASLLSKHRGKPSNRRLPEGRPFSISPASTTDEICLFACPAPRRPNNASDPADNGPAGEQIDEDESGHRVHMARYTNDRWQEICAQ